MRIVVLGAAGFLGRHLVRHLVAAKHDVLAVDRHHFMAPGAKVVVADLTDKAQCNAALASPCDRLYQFAAEMGGAGYIFTGKNDYQILSISTIINLNVLDCIRTLPDVRVLFASSACVYPIERQSALETLSCAEDVAYPANPDSEYGWQKLFSERLFLASAADTGISCRIARLHNVYGPDCSWNDGREKAPAAICRKVALAPEGGAVDVWGTGQQSRSFLYVDDFISAITKLMESTYSGPMNIGSTEMISINALAQMVIDISGKQLRIRNTAGPVGVQYRVSSNILAERHLGWHTETQLADGLKNTYNWIAQQASQYRLETMTSRTRA